MIYVRVRTVGTSVLFVVEQSVSVFSGQQPIVEIFGHRIALRQMCIRDRCNFQQWNGMSNRERKK